MTEQCPVCDGKKKKVIRSMEFGKSIYVERTRFEDWDYELDAGEDLVAGCCEDCGVKFWVPKLREKVD